MAVQNVAIIPNGLHSFAMTKTLAEMTMKDTLYHSRIGSATRRGFSALLLITQLTLFLQCKPAEDFSGKEDSEKSEVEVFIVKSGSDEIDIGRIEAFVFSKDDGRLDVCQKFDSVDGESLNISSTSGARTVYLLANVPERDYRWSEIGTVQNFRNMLLSLENDSLERPVMTGTAEFSGRSGEKCSVTLSPVSARICLNSLRCDFSGTAYEGQSLKNLRVYLCNVNADSRIDSSAKDAFRFINTGGLHDDDVKRFRSPGIVCQSLGIPVDSKGITPKLEFLCYTNPAKEEGFASAFTRLVIEGSIDGRTWYYPINIAGGAPVKSGCSYTYDVVLKRKGCTDPEYAVSLTDIEASFSIGEWKEQKEYVAEF